MPQPVAPRTIENEAQRQRDEVERRSAPPRQTGPAVSGPERGPPVTFPAGGTTVVLKQIELGASAFLSAAELDAIRTKYLDRKVDLAQIGALVQEINDLYAAKGQITASAVLPPQKLDAGVLKISLIEGKLGAISVTGVAQTSPSYLKSQIRILPNDVVDTPELNREVSIFNRLNEVQLRAQLKPGGQFGLTDLELAATEPPRAFAQVSYDNQAVNATGRYQGALFLKYHGLFGIDDRLTFYGTRSRGSILGSGSYNLPISPFGTRFGVSFTRSTYRIVTGPAKELRPNGESESRSLNLSQPVFATDAFLLQLTGSLTQGNSTSEQLNIDTARTKYSKATGGLSLNLTLPGYLMTLSPTVSQVDWTDRLGLNKRNFVLYAGSTTHVLRLTDDIYASLAGSWQYTNEKQLPADQIFQIGGPTTVRGYPIGSAFGDSGYYGQAELHYVLPEPLRSLDAFVFLDHGATFAPFPAVTRETAVGAGLAWRPVDWASIEGGAAHALQRASTRQRDVELYFRLSLRKSL